MLIKNRRNDTTASRVKLWWCPWCFANIFRVLGWLPLISIPARALPQQEGNITKHDTLELYKAISNQQLLGRMELCVCSQSMRNPSLCASSFLLRPLPPKEKAFHVRDRLQPKYGDHAALSSGNPAHAGKHCSNF